MWRLIFAALLLNLLLLTKAIDVYDDEELAKVEDEDDVSAVTNTEKNANLPSFRNARILWPFPFNNRSDPIKGNQTPEAEDMRLHLSKLKSQNRKARFGFWPYPQSPIVDMMFHTLAVDYSPANANDAFDFLRDPYPLPKGLSEPFEEYDYIIVGAGTSGSVLASRLTEEKPRSTVLLLEAGRPEMLLSDIPALTQYLQQTDYVWPYTLEHQPGVCLGSEEQRCYMPRGKALGGSSVTNSMVHASGRPEDWNQIAEDGNYGWNYERIGYYYLKSYAGCDAELNIEKVPFKTGLVEAFLAAGRYYGYPTDNYNEKLTFGYVKTVSYKGHRLSAAKAYLHQHKRRKNLHILTEAKATKILVDPQSKKAYGVEYIKNNIKRTVWSRREIILAAGPIGSPQLLMLSGIGPKEHLQTLGIPVIADRNVGRSLYDHVSFPGVVFKLNSTNASLLEPKVATLSNLIQWLQFGDGLLSTPGGVEAIGYLKTPLSQEPTPDIELASIGGSLTSDSGGAIRKSWKITDRTYFNSFGSLSGVDTWQAIPTLLKPKSKGYLELRDTSPFSHPKIFGNYLSDPKDLATLKEAVKFIIKLGESQPFRKYNASLYLAPYPSCSTHPLGSEEYWECAIRTMIVSARNPIATCKMGPETDPDAVVDPELRVYGVEKLRVVDASIIPRPLTGRTHTAEVIIGEKAADMIKRAWSNLVE